ncbi:MAG TPA: EcsC family protein [Methylovirgula sp.]|jgi:hypothetical protein|nr:EcsC family protein [Methylovirgula sp.]
MTLYPVATIDTPTDSMAEADRRLLREAVKNLEHRSLATRLSLVLGQQISRFGKLLPANVTDIVDKAAERAITIGLSAAMRSLNTRRGNDRRFFHKAAATLSGAAGGAFGLASLPIELPVSTLLMLRSIAAIAKAEGEDLKDPETTFACIQVFALGGQDVEQRLATDIDGKVDPHALTESGYFAVRAVLAQSVSEAARFVVERGLVEETAPVILRVVSQVATRFGMIVSQKVAAQAVPIIGAAGGAAINYAFIDHFQTLARGHFAVRRLERIYGPEVVRTAYDAALRETSFT